MNKEFAIWMTRKMFREIWEWAFRPPTPSDFFVLIEEDEMSGTFKATILLPVPRQDETDFQTDDGKKLIGRRLDYSVGVAAVISVDIPFTQPSFEIKGVPSSTNLTIDLYDKLEDGSVGHANSRTVTSPPAEKVIPVPGAVDVQWTPESDTASTDV